MGALAAALALAFMHFHWGLKKVYLRLGLHVSTFLLLVCDMDTLNPDADYVCTVHIGVCDHS